MTERDDSGERDMIVAAVHSHTEPGTDDLVYYAEDFGGEETEISADDFERLAREIHGWEPGPRLHGVSASSRLDAVIADLRKRIKWLSGDPGTILSPDGWGEREGAKEDLEEVLEVAEGKQPA